MTNLTEYLQFPPVMRWETNTVALGGAGGPMNVPLQQLTNRTAWLKAQVDAINLILAGDGSEPFIVNNLTSESITSVLAANQGRVLLGLINYLSNALADKLDASAYNERYKGLHLTPEGLAAAHPSAVPGDYAGVDAGSGTDAILYFWDVEGGWVTSGSSMSLSDTDALVEGTNHLYFRTDRAIAAGATAFARYDEAQSLNATEKARHHANVGTFDINTNNLEWYVVDYEIQTSDNIPNTIIRTNSDSPNTVAISPILTHALVVRQAGVGITTLVEAGGAALIGNLVFAGQHDAKEIVPVGGGVYDVYGA